MLIAELQPLWFVALVIVIFASALIALFTRDSDSSEPVSTLMLSDEERKSLEMMALETKKKLQEKNKLRREKRMRQRDPN